MVGASVMDMIAYVPRLPHLGETLLGKDFQLGFGGKGANQAVSAAKLGATCSIVTKVGEDSFGRDTRANFVAHGVCDEHVLSTSEGPTGVAPISVDANGDNSIVVVMGANDKLTEVEVEAARPRIKAADILVVQLELPTALSAAAMRIARAEGVTTVLNTAPAQADLPDALLALADIVCPNQTEADLGKRTDILFVAVPDLPEVSRGRVVAEGLRPQRPVGGAGLRPIAASCSLRSASNWTCPFRAYVAACFEPHAQATFTAAATGEVALALGCVRPPIISESRRFEALRLRDGRVRPSSGFMLFLALVHQCDHLSLYGFDDRLTTMDGHFLSPSHRLVSEHLAMRTILEYERTRAAAIGLRNRSFAIE